MTDTERRRIDAICKVANVKQKAVTRIIMRINTLICLTVRFLIIANTGTGILCKVWKALDICKTRKNAIKEAKM